VIRPVSILNDGFVDEHDRNIVPHRVDAMAGNAAKAASIGLQFNFSPAGRANQNLEQIGADSHVETSLAA